jgi:phosphatidylethanolamine/phosphatidyl-N-methylethanolamine N-methyltransferase
MSQTDISRGSGLFFRQWLRSPRYMGAILPSSSVLASAIAEHVEKRPGAKVVELGGGTGTITRGLLDAGVAADDLIVLEMAEPLYRHLREHFPGVHVVLGDAGRLREHLDRLGVERVATVISGLPLLSLPFEFQQAVFRQSFEAMGGRGKILQYTYSLTSPARYEQLGATGRRVKRVLRNVPPASVWCYEPAGAAAAVS